MAKQKSMADRFKQKHTAYHEAGHAVAAVVEELQFPEVTINPNEVEGTLGHVLLDGFDKRFRPDVQITPRRGEQLMAYALVAYAGAAGAGLYAGRDFDWTGAGEDRRKALNYLSYLESEPEALGAMAKMQMLRARNVIKLHWRAVELIAKRLLAQPQRKMSFADVHTAMMDCGRARTAARSAVTSSRAQHQHIEPTA